MLINALGIAETRAGIPAGLATLKYLLSVATRPDVSRSELVSAIELDPALLLNVLPRQTIGNTLSAWHHDLTTSMLASLALDAAISVQIDPDNRSLTGAKGAILAEEFATRTGLAGPNDCRISASLAHASVYSEDIPQILEERGVSSLVADAVRYQTETAEQLAGVAPIVRIVWAARALTTTENESGPSAETVRICAEMIDVGDQTIIEAWGAANWRFEQLLRSLPTTGVGAEQELTGVIRAAILDRAFTRSEDADTNTLIETAAFALFRYDVITVFRADGDRLCATFMNAPVEIEAKDERSLIARCFRTGVIEENARGRTFEHVIEQQLARRYPHTDMILIPAGREGVVVCAGTCGPLSEPLLNGFADSVRVLLRNVDEAVAPTITLEALQATTREIIHEVNNPLAIVQNYLRTLALKVGEDHPVNTEVDAISRELQRVSALLGKFRQIGQEETLAVVETCINDLILELVGGLEAANPDLAIVTSLDETIPMLQLPEQAIRQILVNLTRNAVEALEGMRGGTITINTQGAVNMGGRHYLEIDVVDNGPGMTPTERLTIFESGTTTKGEGRGLGLGIVFDLVERMSGMIACRDNNGGTGFQLLIPFHHDPRSTTDRRGESNQGSTS